MGIQEAIIEDVKEQVKAQSALNLLKSGVSEAIIMKSLEIDQDFMDEVKKKLENEGKS